MGHIWVTIWGPYGFCKRIPYGSHMGNPYGAYMGSIWIPYGSHMGSIWHLYGAYIFHYYIHVNQMGLKWGHMSAPYGLPIWDPYGFFRWDPCRSHMGSPYELNMGPIWALYGSCKGHMSYPGRFNFAIWVPYGHAHIA